MKQITKMRIIHTLETSPEAEYLKTFFEYIGIMVHDEIVQNEYAIYQHLNLANDDGGVDIVLNFSPEVLSRTHRIPIPNRFYVYYSSNKKQCALANSIDDYRILREMEPYTLPQKKEIRIEVLGLLIDMIWETDEENRVEIQKIKDYYVSKDEDRDLFYILQAKKQIDNLFWVTKILKVMVQKYSNNEPGKKSVFLENIEIDEYVERMFLELWRMCCLLKNNDNSYARYAKINTELLLYTLNSYIYIRSKSKLERIEFNGLNLQILPHEFIIDSLADFVENNSLFELAHVMLSKLAPDFRGSIYPYLINKCENSRFPAYYSSIYCDIGIMFFFLDNDEKAMLYFRKSIKLNPLNIKSSYFMGNYFFRDGKFKMANEYALLPFEMLGIDGSWMQVSNTPLPSSLQFELWIINYLRFLIQLENGLEYSMRSTAAIGYACAFNVDSANLTRTLADDDEGAFAEFIKYNEFSEYCWTLYGIASLLANFVNDPFIKKLIDEKLSRWVDDVGEFVSGTPKDANDKQYQKEFKPQEQ